MLRFKRKYSLVDRFIARNLDGGEINHNIFSDLCGKSHSLFKKDLLAHFGCINSVEFSEDGAIFVSGSDDRRVLLWSISDAYYNHPVHKPITMEAEHSSNVFCLAISQDNQQIFSGGNDFQTIVHDVKSAKPIDYFLHEKPVYGISLQPSSQSIFATACDDGNLRVFDMRCSVSAETTLASKRSPFHSIMFHPVEGRIVVSANAKDGIELWDLRNPLTCLHRYPNEKGAMSARFNSLGNRILCLRRRESPQVYHLYHDGEIQLRAVGYTNSCTMKSCCFAGEGDEYAISGSDDHNIYIWKIPITSEDDNDHIFPDVHMVLKGHRSVVNHVRYNSATCSLASCGVEKMIKIWSAFAFTGSSGGLDREAAENSKPRKQLGRFPLNHGRLILAPSPNFRTTDEDKKMLAFFDLLVERSTWNTSGEEDTTDSENDDDSVAEDDNDEDDENEFSISQSTSSENEESFEIDSVSTPSSTDSEGPIAGPSGLQLNNLGEPSKLELPSQFHTHQRFPFRMTLKTSSEDDEANVERLSSTQEGNQDPVVFRSLPDTKKRQFRKRTKSTDSSS